MKNKLASLKIFLKKIFKKKRTWIILGIVLIICIFSILKPNADLKNIVSEKVEYTDLKQTVLATGQVISITDLDLSFNASGIVNSIKIKVGDMVKLGQVLAILEQGSEAASLTQARGALAAANARYKGILEGSSSEEITLAKVSLENAEKDYENTKITQSTLVKNAYYNLLNSTPEAIPKDGKGDYTAPVISGSYNLGKEGQIEVNSYYSFNGISFNISGLVSGNGMGNSVIAQPLGNSGLDITFPSSTSISGNSWIIEIPNKKASDYLSNYNAYQSALKTEQQTVAAALSLVNQKTAELAIKQATARQSDIDLARADIISAKGQVQQAQAQYNNTIITAPVGGTITSIDIETGELALAQKEAIVLQDISNIYIEANINEANIARINTGMPVDITFDAFGAEKVFKGSITKIDPASTIISGVVNYKITTSVEQVENLRPGMTANMTIRIEEKDHVLTIPQRAILVDETGRQTIRLISNSKNKKFKEVPISTGVEGDGGVVEILSGLKEGNEFVVLIKSK